MFLPVLLITTFYCPVCGGSTHVNQWKLRSAWCIDDMVTGIPQLQVLCTNPSCKKTHVIIPDFLNPYKRYVGAEIEACICVGVGQVEEVPVTTEAEESTIRRWKRQFAERLPYILTTLIRLLMIEYENMISLLDCSQGFKRLRELVEHFPERKAATVLGRTNLELFAGASRQYF